MKRRLLSLFFSIVLMLTMVLPASAEVSATDMRHSVVRVEVGCQGEAGFEWLSGGTGFFVGEEGENPSYLLTNYHVIDTFIQLGSGTEISMAKVESPGASFISWYIQVVEGISTSTYNSMSEEDQNELINAIINNVWVKFAGSNLNNSFRSLIRVYYDDRDFDEAYLVEGVDEKDMALLRLDKPTDKRAPIAVCEPTEYMVRHAVTAIGYSGASGSVFDPVTQKGENDSTVSGGTVSRLQTQTGTGLRIVQYDASINSGNSGGPLVLDENGAVIAINTWGTSGDSNMFFGVSMSEVIPMLDRNNVKYMLEEDPFDPEKNTKNTSETDTTTPESTNTTDTTTTSDTDTNTTNTTTTSDTDTTTSESTTTTTEDSGITIFGYTFTYTQVIIGVIGLLALIAIIVFAVRHFKKKDDDVDQNDKNNKDDSNVGDNVTMVSDPPVSPPVPPVTPPRPPVDPSDSLFRIQCVRGALGTKRLAIPATGEVIMGRNEGCGIRFPSNTKGVSGRHCAVYYEGGAVYIKDIGSSFGTFIEPGRRLSVNESVMIPQGKKFWLGSENECFVIDHKK